MARVNKMKANRFYQKKRGVGSHRAADLSKEDLVAVTADKTLTADDSGSLIMFNDADGATITLPAATGTGNVYKFVVGVTVTSNSDIIQCANTTDEFAGNVSMIDTDDDSQVNYPALAADNFDTVTMNGTTTGGIAGSVVKVTDIKSGLFLIEGLLIASGVVATPLSAA